MNMNDKEIMAIIDDIYDKADALKTKETLEVPDFPQKGVTMTVYRDADYHPEATEENYRELYDGVIDDNTPFEDINPKDFCNMVSLSFSIGNHGIASTYDIHMDSFYSALEEIAEGTYEGNLVDEHRPIGNIIKDEFAKNKGIEK